MGICKSTNESNNNENLTNSPKYQTTANSESIPADKKNSSICENFNNGMNNNMNNGMNNNMNNGMNYNINNGMNYNINNGMNYNINNGMNYNMNNNFSSQYNPNLFSYNYLNGTSPEINGIVYSPNSFYNSKNNIRNITFATDTGIKTSLIVPPNITIYQLISMYMNRRGLSNYDLRRDFKFFFNTESLDPFSKELIGKKFGNYPYNLNITVSKTMNVIGGLKLY